MIGSFDGFADKWVIIRKIDVVWWYMLFTYSRKVSIFHNIFSEFECIEIINYLLTIIDIGVIFSIGIIIFNKC